MTTKAKLLLVGGVIMTAQFAIIMKIVAVDGALSGIYTPTNEWIRVVLIGAAAFSLWMLFLRARREKPPE